MRPASRLKRKIARKAAALISARRCCGRSGGELQRVQIAIGLAQGRRC
jgi:ABC-type hemin transport system ATPase subunit